MKHVSIDSYTAGMEIVVVMGRNYWMISTTLDDFLVTRDRGYSVFGMGSKYRRRAQRMQPDDRMLLYVKQLRKWTGVVSVTSEYFEDRTPIWNVGTRGENYPYRVRIKTRDRASRGRLHRRTAACTSDGVCQALAT